MKLQWQGDNLHAVQRLLVAYGTVRYLDFGRRSLQIVAKEFAKAGGVDSIEDVALVVELGDTLHYRPGTDGMSDSIGIERPPYDGGEGEITWNGANAFDISMFVRKHDMTVRMSGDDLILKESQAAKRAQEPNAAARLATGVLSGSDNFIRMRRGDKLLRRNGCIFMSRSGRDHQAA
jgi:hypothetical protein